MENKVFWYLKLENIELICKYEKRMDFDYTYSIAFTNIDTNELFICEYTFNYKFQSELWYDSIYSPFSKPEFEEIDVFYNTAELIYIPKYKCK